MRRVGSAPTAREGLIQDHETVNLCDVEQSPTAREGPRADLVDEQASLAVLNAVIMRLRDPRLGGVRELEQPTIADSGFQLMINERNNICTGHAPSKNHAKCKPADTTAPLHGLFMRTATAVLRRAPTLCDRLDAIT